MEEGVLISDKLAEKKAVTAGDRLAICRSCPLFIDDISVCNPALWMNPQTGETSKRGRPGFVKGCGCLITRKARQPNSHCHLGRW